MLFLLTKFVPLFIQPLTITGIKKGFKAFVPKFQHHKIIFHWNVRNVIVLDLYFYCNREIYFTVSKSWLTSNEMLFKMKISSFFFLRKFVSLLWQMWVGFGEISEFMVTTLLCTTSLNFWEDILYNPGERAEIFLPFRIIFKFLASFYNTPGNETVTASGPCRLFSL